MGTTEMRTARLVLRRPAPGDIDAILAIHSDPQTCAHNPSDALTSLDEARQLYMHWTNQWERDGYGYWVVLGHDATEPLGFCGIKPTRLGDHKALNLFCRLAAASWGQGYAGEATAAVLAWAARHLPDLPVVARIRPGNIASQRMAVRVGLSRAEHLDGPGYDGLDWIYTSEPLD